MIKNLRKRFIFAAMASTFGVLFVIMSILNIANYARMVSRADDTLSELVDNNGQFDRRDFLKEKVKTNADSQPPDKPDGKSNDKFSPETPFQTRYFSVVVSDGAVESYSLDNIAAVDESEAESYALKILGDGSDSGFTDIYRYRVADCEDGTRIIFVDCRQELESFRNTLVYSVGVSLL